MSTLPIQGQQYTIKSGDTLIKIASRAYGNPALWSKIYRANETVLRSSDPDEIYPGEVIFIPLSEEKQEAQAAQKSAGITGKNTTDWTVIISGRQVPLMNNKFVVGINYLCRSWSGELTLIPGVDAAIDKILQPYAYPAAELYIGNNLMATGKLYHITPKVNASGTVVTLEFFSKTADIVDSMLKPPYEYSSVSLQNVANTIIPPFGVKAIFDIKSTTKFDSVTAKNTETAGAFLQRLATQRGLLVTDDENGNVVFTQAATSKSICALEYGYTSATEWTADFDGRKRFAVYRAVGTAGDGTETVYIAKDSKVPGQRQYTFSQSDTDSGNISNYAKWKRNKILSDALTIPLPVSDWFNPKTGDLWEANTIITVKAPVIGISSAFDLLIQSIEFSQSNSDRSAVLNVLPPSALSDGDIKEPWS